MRLRHSPRCTNRGPLRGSLPDITVDHDAMPLRFDTVHAVEETMRVILAPVLFQL